MPDCPISPPKLSGPASSEPLRKVSPLRVVWRFKMDNTLSALALPLGKDLSVTQSAAPAKKGP